LLQCDNSEIETEEVVFALTPTFIVTKITDKK
jgi:hypothetical protein